MFSSTNPFGQSSTSPFGSQSLFGQANNASSNLFAPKPFGGTTAFGAQTGGSIFGTTATGVFGATQSSSPLATAPAFTATGPAFGIGSSVPSFGTSSTPAFGAASSPAFGSGSTSSTGSSLFGQKPAFGGFGPTASQTSPFGSTSQQTQSAFGSNIFGPSRPFGSSSQPTFGATSAPAFGASMPAFGATTATFGSSSTPAFGSTSTGFGMSNMSTFGSGGAFSASSTPAFGASTTAFGSSTPIFGASSAPTFGFSSSSFGGSSTSSFNFGSSPAFGQSASALGSSPFGASSSPFGGQGTQGTTPASGSTVFGQSTFGGQRGGSRVAAYTPIPEADSGSSTQPAGKLESISAMPIYKDKSHEELRWEDNQFGDKGGPNPAGQPTTGIGFGTPSPSSSSNPFSSKTSVFGPSGFGASSTPTVGSSPFGASTTTNPFGTTAASTPSFAAPAFGASSSSVFGASTSPAFGSSSPSIFGSASAPGTNSVFGSGLNFGNTQSAGLFQSTTTPSLGQTNLTFGQTAPTFGQNTASSFGQSNLFTSPSTGFSSNLFPSTTASSLSASSPVRFGQTTPSLSTPFQAVQNPQSSVAFSFSNFGQTQAVTSSGFGGISSSSGQSAYGSQSASYGLMVMQLPPVTNPFGTLPAMPQMSIGRVGSTPAIQYGISCMPATEKPAPGRVSSLLASRHLSQRRIKLPAKRYHPKTDGSKLPFFSNDDETPSATKADVLVIPRENPRALVIHPTEKWPSAVNANKSTMPKDSHTTVNENDKHSDNSSGKEKIPFANSRKPNGIHEDHTMKRDSSVTVTGQITGEAAIVHENGADIKAFMPKIRHSDYYTEPQVEELAAKERVEPGFCHRVKDFVVGRHGYGSILFIGETDVCRLDLESLVQFNNREVIVYMDENQKPPVGQGLNKPAEVTLLNIKCYDKMTGQQYTEGAKVDKYKEMLMKKAQEQGAEFVSYDPIKGEWKFRVKHFSCYKLDHAGEDDLDAQPQVLPPC